jgi:hypothetical protein
VHAQGWKENKVACMHTLQGPTFAQDPHPEPPACFLDPQYVDELVQDLKAHKRLGEDTEEPAAAAEVLTSLEMATLEELASADGPPGDEQPGGQATPQPAEQAKAGAAGQPRQEQEWPPKRVVRTCVSTQQNSAAFGPLVAQEAYARGFYAAARRAFLGDGQAYNWTIQQKWFKDFEPIADFIHPLSYLYVSATAVAASQAERWELYQGWLLGCWQGRAGAVLGALKGWQERLGPILPEEKPPGSDARVVVGKAVTYLENNQARMDYPRYRRRGLPVTSCAVESLIKEFNYRVKGTEKFWNRPGGTETILQVRAAVLSEDDRLRRHLDNRPGSPWRRYRAKEPHP